MAVIVRDNITNALPGYKIIVVIQISRNCVLNGLIDDTLSRF